MPREAITVADLPLAVLDADSPVPLYYQVESDLRRLIEAEVLGAGALLPPEQDLSRAYGVSRHTVRQAMARLAADGLIARSAGRGTHVQPHTTRAAFHLDRSFTQQMAELGLTAHARVLRCEPGVVEAADPPALQAHHGEPLLRLDRLRLGDDEPVGLQHARVLTKRCPDLAAHDFAAASLYEVLARDYGLTVTEIQHTVSAAAASEAQAEALQVRPGSPLLVVRTTAFLDPQQAIEHTTSYYRADRYEYRTVQRA